MTSLMEVFKKPFAEKSLIDSMMIFSLSFKLMTPRQQRDRPVGLFATLIPNSHRVKSKTRFAQAFYLIRECYRTAGSSHDHREATMVGATFFAASFAYKVFRRIHNFITGLLVADVHR
jgi:hypothetical protein